MSYSTTKDPDLDLARMVRIHTRQTNAGIVDTITIVIGGIHFLADLTSDRAIRLAKRLAENHRCRFEVTTEMQERVALATDPER